MGPTTNTPAHRAFRAWWKAHERGADGKTVLTRAGFARRLGLTSGQAVSGWLRRIARPERVLWPAIKSITGIDESEWMTAEERRRDRALADVVAGASS